jgi:hypothetical protein
MIHKDIMHRINCKSFLDFTNDEVINHVSNLHTLRHGAIEEARALARSKVKMPTKSATRNRAKRGLKTKNPVTALAKLLKTMSPAQRDALLKGVL